MMVTPPEDDRMAGPIDATVGTRALWATAMSVLLTCALLAPASNSAELPGTSAPAPGVSAGPPSDPKALQALVAELDRQMFAAYNAHDVDGLLAYFAPDVEFFHDTDGLLGFADVRTGFARVFAGNPDIRRELVPGTMRVYPLKGYGAIQTGQHRFCHTENGRPDCGTFEFLQIWRWRDGRWQVAREVSYGH
jgi:ketosteroid isomerase-like protein